MILFLRRKMGLLGRSEDGQSLAFVATSLLIMFLFVCVTVDVGDFVAQKVDVQNDADAMAISTAVWEARGLNVIQSLNITKNWAHLHYMLEMAEVIYHIVSGNWIEAWLATFWYDEGLAWEKPELETELETLTEIQKFIAGLDDYDISGGSAERFMHVAMPFIDTNNNNGELMPTSTAVNWTASLGLVYDPKIRIVMEDRAPFVFILWEAFGEEIDEDTYEDVKDIIDFFEVEFEWAVQDEDEHEDQYTVGFAVRNMRRAPMFGGEFVPTSVVGEAFGSLPLFETDVQLAIAQARPFKPDPYTLDPMTAENGIGANLLALPFSSELSDFLGGVVPEGNSNCFWDVKLTPVTVMNDLALPLAPLMTH